MRVRVRMNSLVADKIKVEAIKAVRELETTEAKSKARVQLQREETENTLQVKVKTTKDTVTLRE